MKVANLLEAKAAIPDWVSKIDADYKAMLKEFGFTLRQKPVASKNADRWIIGGTLKWDGKGLVKIPFEMVVKGTQQETGKFLLDLVAKGHETAILGIHVTDWLRRETTPRFIRDDDTMARISGLLDDTFFINQVSGKPKPDFIDFHFAVGPKPETPKEEPKKAPVLRVVKKAK